jgi:NDP-sugar pyrophosphorylase family protein
MQIVILAGGLGTRVRNFTNGLPKSLMMIQGKPFLDYQLLNLEGQGFFDFHFCLGVGGKEILSYLDANWSMKIKITHSFDSEEGVGTAAALAQASNFLDDEFALVYGDSYLDQSLAPSLDEWRGINEQSMMTIKSLPWQIGLNNVAIEGRHVSRYEKGTKSAKLTHIDFGFQLFRKPVLDTVSRLHLSDLGRLNQYLIERKLLVHQEVTGQFYEIGSMEGIQQFENFMGRHSGLH